MFQFWVPADFPMVGRSGLDVGRSGHCSDGPGSKLDGPNMGTRVQWVLCPCRTVRVACRTVRAMPGRSGMNPGRPDRVVRLCPYSLPSYPLKLSVGRDLCRTVRACPRPSDLVLGPSGMLQICTKRLVLVCIINTPHPLRVRVEHFIPNTQEP